MFLKKADASQLGALAAAILFVIGLGLFAYLGFFNRYWADDWCYNADLKELGLIGALKGYTYITTYASNRFSLTLFAGFFYAPGIFGVQIMTLLFILFWFLGLAWILGNVNKLAGSPASRPIVLALAAGVTYYSMYLAPHLYQSMYWRSGVLPYTAALVFGLGAFGVITSQAASDKPAPIWVPVAGVLAFLAGGFSESGVSGLVTAMALYVLGAWFYRRRAWAQRSLATSIAALAGALAAMIVLVISPTSDHRLALYGEPAGLLELPGMVVSLTSDFILFSFSDAPLPHLAILATFALLGFMLYEPNKQKLEPRTWLWLIAGMAVVTFVLIAASYAPSAYIEQAPPATRSRIIPRFELVLFLAAAALCTGYFLRPYLQSAWLPRVATVLLILALFYSARSLWITSAKIPLYSQRAVLWDERDAQIRQAHAQGLQEVHVRGIDSLPIGGLRDLKAGPGSGYWVNICAERFYGVENIYADVP